MAGLGLVLAGAMTLLAPAAAHAESNGGVPGNGTGAQVWSAR